MSPTHDEQAVAIALRHAIVEMDDTRAGGIQALPAGGVMLRAEGYQFTIEYGRDAARYVVIVRREPTTPEQK